MLLLTVLRGSKEALLLLLTVLRGSKEALFCYFNSSERGSKEAVLPL